MPNLVQEILADAVDRLCPPEKRGSIIRNSANVVSFEETKDPATGVWAMHWVGCGKGVGPVDCGVSSSRRSAVGLKVCLCCIHATAVLRGV